MRNKLVKRFRKEFEKQTGKAPTKTQLRQIKKQHYGHRSSNI